MRLPAPTPPRSPTGAGLLACRGVAVVVLVEDPGSGAPARPAGEGGLLVRCRPPPLVGAAPKHAQRGEVGVEFRSGAGRGEISLAAGSERRRALRPTRPVRVEWVG
ncbi:MAG: hypothetical protein U5R31_17050 [Acidimicrobiia bacterium]|nr:hypothetical protein [Acidimicrobiia bacterium]